MSVKRDKIVNFVKENMEFGARALGNTTTFALPCLENVEYINHINKRHSLPRRTAEKRHSDDRGQEPACPGH